MADPKGRRVVIYSGNMLNGIAEEHVVAMDVIDHAVPLGVAIPDGSWIRYTWLDHVPKDKLGDQVGEVPSDLMEIVNTRLFMVLTTS